MGSTNYFLLLSCAFVFCILTFNLSSPVFAQAPPPGCKGTVNDPATFECGGSGIKQAQELLSRLISISTTIAFMALTVWLIWGALKFFITSGGDPKALAHAWMSVTWTFLGIFFMVLAYLSLKLIWAVTGAPVDLFCLGFPPYCADTLIRP